jgi:hypothetical protein
MVKVCWFNTSYLVPCIWSGMVAWRIISITRHHQVCNIFYFAFLSLFFALVFVTNLMPEQSRWLQDIAVVWDHRWFLLYSFMVLLLVGSVDVQSWQWKVLWTPKELKFYKFWMAGIPILILYFSHFHQKTMKKMFWNCQMTQISLHFPWVNTMALFHHIVINCTVLFIFWGISYLTWVPDTFCNPGFL